MIRYVISIMMLAILYLLANTSAGYTACGWLLWAEQTDTFSAYRTEGPKIPGEMPGNVKHSWDILASFTTKMECTASQEREIARMLRDWQKQKDEDKYAELIISEQSYKPGTNVIGKFIKYVEIYTRHFSTHIRYLCLPDTIDPSTTRH
jgi:hypothetical protein